MAILTDRSLRRKWAGKDEWLSDGGSRGAGRLVAKLSAGGIICLRRRVGRGIGKHLQDSSKFLYLFF